MVTVAMIGSGGYAYVLLNLIWKMPDKIKLTAVRSDPRRVSEGAQVCKQKGIRVYEEVDDLLSDMQGKANVIIVPTPINTHFSLAKRCLEAGFDVFLEKPPVVTIQDHDELLSITKIKCKQVAVMFQCLYTDILHKLQQRIIANDFGKLKKIKGIAGWPRPNSYFTRNRWSGKIKIDGEWILDGTINNPLAHMLCNQLFLASSEPGILAVPKTVQAELYHGHNIESEDTSSVRVVTDNDIEILFNTSLCTEEYISADNTIECERATIKFVNFTTAIIKYNTGQEEIMDESNESHHRLPMLEKLANTYETSKNYLGSLEICRPFTLLANSAFESASIVETIDSDYIESYQKDDKDFIKIKNIEHILKQAHTKGKLFSEINAPWAKPSRVFELKGYTHFPKTSITS